MTVIKTNQLRKGLCLAEDVISPLGGVLLYKDTLIEEYHKDLLTAFTINSVKIQDFHSQGTKSKVKVGDAKLHQTKKEKQDASIAINSPDVAKKDFQKQYADAVHFIKNVMIEVEYTKKIPLMEIRSILKPLVDQVCEQPKILFAKNQMRSNEEYTYQHLIGVSLISALIAKFMNYKENELMAIALAGIFHDIGKTRISDEILNKKGTLNQYEFEEMKKHPLYGYEILKNITGLHPGVALAALEHHEREDGNGYPYGRKSYEIHPYGKIIAVADIFNAMTSERVYKEAKNIYQVLKQLNADAFGKLDPQVVRKLINGLLTYCVGNTVTLSGGKIGEIVFINNQEPLSPLIKVGNDFIDLSQRSDISIESMDLSQ